MPVAHFLAQPRAAFSCPSSHEFVACKAPAVLSVLLLYVISREKCVAPGCERWLVPHMPSLQATNLWPAGQVCKVPIALHGPMLHVPVLQGSSQLAGQACEEPAALHTWCFVHAVCLMGLIPLVEENKVLGTPIADSKFLRKFGKLAKTPNQAKE